MVLFSKKQSDVPRRRLASEGSNSESGKQRLASDMFRRNRTLTGTTSSGIDSTMNVKSDMESSRMHVHHLTNKRRKIMSAFIVVLVASLLLFTIISNLTARVAVSVSNQEITKSIDKSVYIQAIQDYLNVNPIGRLNFFLDNNALSAFVSQRLPEVSSVAQNGMSTFGQTEFNVIMREPVAGWRLNDKQYYVDSSGVSFNINYFADPSVQIIDNSGVSAGSGAAIVSNRLLGFVGRVVSVSKAYGLIVTQATLPPDTTREIDITIKGSKYFVKMSVDRPVGEQVEDMSRAIKYFKSKSIGPSYIDVRVSGKAFYI